VSGQRFHIDAALPGQNEGHFQNNNFYFLSSLLFLDLRRPALSNQAPLFFLRAAIVTNLATGQALPHIVFERDSNKLIGSANTVWP
jgi:hypothetical protein